MEQTKGREENDMKRIGRKATQSRAGMYREEAREEGQEEEEEEEEEEKEEERGDERNAMMGYRVEWWWERRGEGKELHHVSDMKTVLASIENYGG